MTLAWLVLTAATACPPVPCSCSPEGDADASAIQAAAAEADAVLLARVARVERLTAYGAEWLEATLDVQRRWKGPDAGRLRVRTPAHAALCGFPFERGALYLVYAQADPADGRLLTDACMRTRARIRADADIAGLNLIFGTGTSP